MVSGFVALLFHNLCQDAHTGFDAILIQVLM
jgi:hypothetical protein